MTRLIAHSGQELHPGDTAKLDGNETVTILAITPPYEEGDPGSIEIQHAWGSASSVIPRRIRAYISL